MSAAKLTTLLRQCEPALYQKVQSLAQYDGVTATDIVRMAVMQFMESQASVRRELVEDLYNKMEQAKRAEMDDMKKLLDENGTSMTDSEVERLVMDAKLWMGRV